MESESGVFFSNWILASTLLDGKRGWENMSRFRMPVLIMYDWAEGGAMGTKSRLFPVAWGWENISVFGWSKSTSR